MAAFFAMSFSEILSTAYGWPMNYLAHVYLAGKSSESVVGNLLADHVRGPLDAYPDGVIAGIHNHRAVDAYTDNHPQVAEARRLFQPPLRRYAGIILDVFWDHCLTKRWSAHTEQPLAEFATQAYSQLAAYDGYLPPDFVVMRDRLIQLDLLQAYGELSTVDHALLRISQRFCHVNPLPEGGHALRQHYEQLFVHFDAFFPDLVQHVANGR
jgi:acyl carrier protein phosphodiesterase